MAATYDITSHPLLSEKAKKLHSDDPSAFDSVVVAAERALGLHGTSFTGDEQEDAKLAVVLETNFELEQTPESQVASSIKRGERTTQYKSKISTVHPRAELIARRLLDSLKASQKSSRSSSSVGVSTEYWG